MAYQLIPDEPLLNGHLPFPREWSLKRSSTVAPVFKGGYKKVPCRILAGAETFLCLAKSGLNFGGIGDEVCLEKGFLAAIWGRNGDVPEN